MAADQLQLSPPSQFYRTSWMMDYVREYCYDTTSDYVFYQWSHDPYDCYYLVTGTFVEESGQWMTFEDARLFSFVGQQEVMYQDADMILIPTSGGKMFSSMLDDGKPSLVNRQDNIDSEIISITVCVFFLVYCIRWIFSSASRKN